MKIKSVQLENIRSHVKSTISLADGFNCLVGGLGTGKSSVLYAVDFALFGDPLSRSYNYLLREGTDGGKVAIKFTYGGKDYTIERGLQRQGESIRQDAEQLKFFEGKKLIASMRNEAVAEQLNQITGIDKDTFRDIIWVRQEHLKELLDSTPRERQKHLDELFGLSDYEAAWRNIVGVKREYEGEKKAYEQDYDVVGIEKLQKDYNQTVEEFSIIENQLHDLKNQVINAKSVLDEATFRLQNLEELKKQTEGLRRKEAEFRISVANNEDGRTKIVRNIEQKKNVIVGLEQRLKRMGANECSLRKQLKEVNVQPSQSITKLTEYLVTLGDQISSVRGEQEATRKEMRSSQKRISTLAEKSQCPLCLQTIPEEYKSALLSNLQNKNMGLEERLAELEINFKELKQLRGTVSNVVSNLQLLTPRIQELDNRLMDELKILDELKDELESKRKQAENLHVQLKAVREKIKKFDVTELEFAREMREKAFEQYSTLKSRLEMTESRKKDVTSRMNEWKERLERVQEKIERVENISKLLEIISGIRGAYRSIQPQLRSEFIKILERFIQQILDDLVETAVPMFSVEIDETYTPFVKSEEGYKREVSNLSGGERTLLAFAYRLGIGQLIMRSRTGHGLYMLLLDEPTESLGSEDGSIERLAEAISRLKSIEQIIAVTHSEVFAEKAEHVIHLEKEAGVSRVPREMGL
ncbi:MAG: SMC family ATPase [Thermoproteota archaeon]|nr:SMC family ATPase [Thermoproteota archaeon]